MEQGHEQRRQSQRRQYGPLSATTRTHGGGPSPGDALNERDEAQECSYVHQRPKRSFARSLGLAASVFFLGAVAWAGPQTTEAAGQQLTVLWAAVLGAIQGATEFLPVSSSGHLSLGQAWLGIDPQSAGHRFNITLHAGTLIAVLWVYRSDVLALLKALARPLQPSDDRQRILMMLLASLPLGIILIPGVEDLVIAMEREVRLIGIALWVTAVTLFLAFREDRGAGDPTPEPPLPWQAIVIGLAQVVAVLPGISRSGATIAAGLAVGLSRANAARFSFLISLIAVGGASAKETLSLLSEPSAGQGADPVPFVVGFVVSLAVGLASLKGLLYLVGKGKVLAFVIYLALVGAVAIAVG